VPDLLTEGGRSRGPRHHAPPEFESRRGRRRATSSSDAVVEVRPQAEIEGLRLPPGKQCPTPPSTTRRIEAQARRRLGRRFADLEDSTTTMAKGDYAQAQHQAGLHQRRGGSVHDGQRLSSTRVGSELVVPKMTRSWRQSRPGDMLKFKRRAPRTGGKRQARRVAFPGSGQGGPKRQGPCPRHRRVGPGGQRVRHLDQLKGRHPGRDGERPADPGPMAVRTRFAPGRSGPSGHRTSRSRSSRKRWSAASTT